jgi:TPR repeat protein
MTGLKVGKIAADVMRKVFYFVAAFTIASSLFAATKQAEEVRRLAEQGDLQAEVKLARMYEEGQGVQKDFGEALKWYQEAAEHGNALAQGTLGWFYQSGQGVETNFQTAISWYRKAAEQGHAMSQLNLAVMYDDGIGTATNKEEAVKWYRLAADQGQPRAQLDLAVMYWRGEGVAQDYKQAWDLFNVVRMTSPDKAAQWRARAALDKVLEELGVDQRRLGRMNYPAWEVVQKYVPKK